MDKRSRHRWCFPSGRATSDLLADPVHLPRGAVLHRQRGEDPRPPDSVARLGLEDDRAHRLHDADLVQNHEAEVGLRREDEDIADQVRAPRDKLPLGASELCACRKKLCWKTKTIGKKLHPCSLIVMGA